MLRMHLKGNEPIASGDTEFDRGDARVPKFPRKQRCLKKTMSIVRSLNRSMIQLRIVRQEIEPPIEIP